MLEHAVGGRAGVAVADSNVAKTSTLRAKHARVDVRFPPRSAVYHSCAGDLVWDADAREWKEKKASVAPRGSTDASRRRRGRGARRVRGRRDGAAAGGRGESAENRADVRTRRGRRYVLAEEAAQVRAEAEAEGVEVPAALLTAPGTTPAPGASAQTPRRPSRRVASLEHSWPSGDFVSVRPRLWRAPREDLTSAARRCKKS